MAGADGFDPPGGAIFSLIEFDAGPDGVAIGGGAAEIEE